MSVCLYCVGALTGWVDIQLSVVARHIASGVDWSVASAAPSSPRSSGYYLGVGRHGVMRVASRALVEQSSASLPKPFYRPQLLRARSVYK
jgi:hypothetical protein